MGSKFKIRHGVVNSINDSNLSKNLIVIGPVVWPVSQSLHTLCFALLSISSSSSYSSIETHACAATVLFWIQSMLSYNLFAEAVALNIKIKFDGTLVPVRNKTSNPYYCQNITQTLESLAGETIRPRSIGPLVTSIFFSHILMFWGLQWLITAPAQPHATEIALHTALLSF